MARTVLIIVASLGLLLSSGVELPAKDAFPAPTKRDKCPVCGMFVSGYQDWLAVVRLKSGKIAYFDGPKDMFTYLLNLRKYDPTAKPTDITEILVKDYYSLAPIDARAAYFVLDSNVTGPMGRELIPLARKQDAEEFKTDHNGKRVLRFNQVTPAVLKSLE